MYICPVCGYDGLRRPPTNFLICPSCGTEFGYSDSGTTYLELQSEWLLNGAHWYSRVTPPPPRWDRQRQLARLNQLTTDTTSTAGEVQVSGVIIPPNYARLSSVRITFFGSESDLARYAQPIHA